MAEAKCVEQQDTLARNLHALGQDAFLSDMGGKPMVSVCVFAYNHEKFLAQALDSVLAQEVCFDIEIVIAEDYSTDSTLEIARSYQTRHSVLIRIEQSGYREKLVINGRMTGRYNFFNGLSRCRGRYIAWLDGDDYWTDKRKLQKQIDFLEAHPDYSFAFHNALLVSDDQEGLPSSSRFHEDILFNGNADDLFVHGNNAPSSSVVFRNHVPHTWPSVFHEVEFADWPLHIFNLNFGKAFYMQDAMSVYRIGSGIWTQRAKSEQLKSMIRFYGYVEEILPERLRKALPDALAEKLTALFRVLIREGRYSATFRLLPKHALAISACLVKANWKRLSCFWPNDSGCKRGA